MRRLVLDFGGKTTERHMNRCRSEGEKQPRVIPCSKGKYGVAGSKFAFFSKSCRKIHRREHGDHGAKVVLIRNSGSSVTLHPVKLLIPAFPLS